MESGELVLDTSEAYFNKNQQKRQDLYLSIE